MLLVGYVALAYVAGMYAVTESFDELVQVLGAVIWVLLAQCVQFWCLIRLNSKHLSASSDDLYDGYGTRDHDFNIVQMSNSLSQQNYTPDMAQLMPVSQVLAHRHTAGKPKQISPGTQPRRANTTGVIDNGYGSQTCSHEQSGSISSRNSAQSDPVMAPVDRHPHAQTTNFHQGFANASGMHDARHEFSYAPGTIGGSHCQCSASYLSRAGGEHHQHQQGPGLSFYSSREPSGSHGMPSPSTVKTGRKPSQTLYTLKCSSKRDKLNKANNGAPKLSLSNGDIMLVQDL